MLDRCYSGLRGLRRFGRRAFREVRRRLERTSTLVHVSILLFVPVLIGLLTYLSNRFDPLSFFLLPPLAAGTYALFARPESEYASPIRFVAGLTVGAVCAWIAMEVAIRVVYPDVPPAMIEVDASGAAFAVLLTSVVTWTLNVEEAAAFSMALLGLLVDPGEQFAFVVSVLGTSSVVAVVFTVWRNRFYEQRAQYLYESTRGDDHVLVPMRGERAEATAMLGGRLAAAHDAGKVVLLDIVEGDRIASAERTRLRNGSDRTDPGTTSTVETATQESDAATVANADVESPSDDADPAVAAAATELERVAGRIESELDVPCRVIVATSGDSPVGTVRRIAAEANCDLIVSPYESEDGEPTPFVARLLNGKTDVVLHRSYDGRTDWRRITVPVRQPGNTAHNMIDFARRLAGSAGHVSVAHCIGSERRRRAADEMLAGLVETSNGTVETRITNSAIEDFLHRIAAENDLVIIGASRDRSITSRLTSPPTFERIDDLETDLAIVARH